MSNSENKPQILVVLTGGTICSSTNEEGHRYSNANDVKIIDYFNDLKKEDCSPFCDQVRFERRIPLDILSENMTVFRWNELLDDFKKIEWEQYKGVIILHGTDTLAYTSSLLSIALAGVPVPVCLVSSQLPLDHKDTNGHANFRASVELIMNGIAPNVYAVYRNSNGVIYAHYGAELMQCANYSDDFFSKSMDTMVADSKNAKLAGKPFETDALLLDKLQSLSPTVLRLVPYVGLDYETLRLDDVRAVVHGTYHSQSVCVERSKGAGDYGNCSILKLIDRCNQRDIPVILAPCSPEAFKYESTGDALNHGAMYVYGMTNEMAYVKTLIGCALYADKKDLVAFMASRINHEILY
jgi:L-asparaginase